MKKRFNIPGVSATPFSGDLSKQRKLNKSVDNLLSEDRFPGDSEHRRLHDGLLRRRKHNLRAGHALSVLLLILAGIGFGAALFIQA